MVHLLYSPLTWLLLLAAVLFARWSALGRGARRIGLAATAIVLLLLTPLGGNALVGFVESRTTGTELCPGDPIAPARSTGPLGAVSSAAAPIEPAVLLSAGFGWDPTLNDPYVALTADSWRRLREGVLDWRRRPDGQLVIAGGGPYPIKESAVLARLARDWGVPAAAIRIEAQSRTTWESAFALRGTTPRRIRLLTTAMHLPRALIAFRAAGFQACAQPIDSDYEPPGGVGYYLPQSSGLEKSEAAVYELVGMVVYRLRAARLTSVSAADALHRPQP